MTKLWVDLETYSLVSITHGTHAYAAGAEIMLFAWAIDDGPVSVWDCTSTTTMPLELQRALYDDGVEKWAHNSHFDRTVMRWNGIVVPVYQWRDTMVQALSHSLPGGLSQLCDILKVPSSKTKDREGKQLIQLFCKPRPSNAKFRRATRETHPDEWARFVKYSALDIEAMRAVHAKLPCWNYKGPELDLWHLDQQINDRGVAVDMDLVQAAMATLDHAQDALSERTLVMTQGRLTSATRTAKMMDFVMESYGIDLPNLQMATVERMLADSDTPQELRMLLEVRLQSTTTSTSKYKTLANGVCMDGRLRGTLQFNGASRTGRWAGRLFQPQNLPRPSLQPQQIEIGIDAIKAGAADLVYDNVMEVLSSVVRGCIVAPKGKKLAVADLSNIEGRVQAWLAGEEWKLEAFRDFDAGIGPDLYKLAYAKSFLIDPLSVTKEQRQIGKVQELALAYAGGVGAFVTFAAAYSIDLDALAQKVLPAAPTWALEEARGFYEWTVKKNPKSDLGLPRDSFIACDALKRVWRKAHIEIATHWSDLQAAAVNAIESPGKTIACRKLKVRRDGAWLRVGLPSGRALCYPSPQIMDNQITYMGVDQYTRKWCRIKTYGGKLFENCCQGVARDVMAHNMGSIEDAGYAIALTVHDEVICETADNDKFLASYLSDLLATNPTWATSMPLAAAGFDTYRYKKE